MKSLIIAEKSSVAADIAKALGNFKKAGRFFERDDMIIVGAVGHLLALQCPLCVKKHLTHAHRYWRKYVLNSTSGLWETWMFHQFCPVTGGFY